MGKRGSLRYQTQQRLESMKAFSQSRHAAKLDGTAREKIFSFQTYRTYSYQLCGKGRFIDWLREHHPGVRVLEEAVRPEFVNGYIQHMKDRGDKPASQATAIAAVAKVAGCSKSDYAPTEPVRRRDIERSRFETASDRLFNAEKNRDQIAVCKALGLRRCELKNLHPEMLHGNERDGWKVVLPPGIAKGGKAREIPVRNDLGTAARAVEVIRGTLPGNRVFSGGIDRRMDVHGLRRDFADAYYRAICRDVRSLPREATYICRGDRAGLTLDRQAMRTVSMALGHSRINVIASHYIK